MILGRPCFLACLSEPPRPGHAAGTSEGRDRDELPAIGGRIGKGEEVFAIGRRVGTACLRAEGDARARKRWKGARSGRHHNRGVMWSAEEGGREEGVRCAARVGLLTVENGKSYGRIGGKLRGDVDHNCHPRSTSVCTRRKQMGEDSALAVSWPAIHLQSPLEGGAVAARAIRDTEASSCHSRDVFSLHIPSPL